MTSDLPLGAAAEQQARKKEMRPNQTKGEGERGSSFFVEVVLLDPSLHLLIFRATYLSGLRRRKAVHY
jgi:hypothetical protein